MFAKRRIAIASSRLLRPVILLTWVTAGPSVTGIAQDPAAPKIPPSIAQPSIAQPSIAPAATDPPAADPPPAEAATIDPAAATPATQQIAIVRQSIAEAQSIAEQTRGYRAEIDAVPARIKTARQALAEPEAIEVSPTIQSVEELTTQSADLQARLQNAIDRAATLQSRPVEVQKRLSEIPGELSAAEQQLTELKDRQSALSTNDVTAAGDVRLTSDELLRIDPDDATESELQSAVLQARIREVQTRIENLQTERDYFKATAPLAPLQLAAAERQIQSLRDQIDRINAEIDRQKQLEVARQNDRLQDAVRLVPESLRPLAQSNVELSELQQNLTARSARLRKTLDQINDAYQQVQTDLETARTRIESVGLTDALGLLLRRKREQNQSLQFKYRPQSDLRKTVAEYQLQIFTLQDEQRELADSGVAAVPPGDLTRPVDWSSLSVNQARDLLIGRRRTLIVDTLQTLESLTTTSLDADTQRRQLLSTIDQYRDFVDGHLFWIRSAPPAGRTDITQWDETAKWLLDGQNWMSVAAHGMTTVLVNPLRCIVLFIFALGMVAFQKRMRREIVDSTPASGGRIPFAQTIASLTWTIGAAAVWPVCFGSLAILFFSIASADPMVRGVSLGLGVITLYLASRELLAESCRDGGLGDKHFGWSPAVRKLIRRNLLWYTSLGGAVLFLLAVYHEHPQITPRTIGTRWLSIALFLLTALFNHCMLRPTSSVYSQIARRNPDSKWVGLRRPIWLAATLIPILFSMLSLGGYLETAFQLGRSTQLTFLLIVVMIIVAGLVDRLFRLRRREELRWQRAKELESAKQAARQAADSGATAGSHPPPHSGAIAGQPPGDDADPSAAVSDIPLEDDEVDLETLDHQSRQLAALLVGSLTVAGLALIWRDVFPAVAFLDGVTAYSVTIDAANNVVESVSLLNIAVTILLGAILFYGIRNLPGLVEFVVLRRTSLDSGAKYAVTSLLRYVLLIIGTIWLLDRLRIPYEQLGWLLAAASVGLGFGLQEIVANFVSGIILLLERPVRVGDVVTIDGQTGLVSKIQIRSTTVTNWDRKELVIPNKDLITEKLLNWSLSNVVNRLVLNVGVAYGSDPDRVRAILTETVLSHPDVLSDPPPMVNLETFGDSSLNFVIRCFLPTLDNRINVTHQLNTKITTALAADGIEIPFPQLDVHHKNTPDH